MTLGELIDYLKALPPSQAVHHGFSRPHSYRGCYEQLAFEPTPDTTVGAMLACAIEALGKTFTGYKGGNYTMGGYIDCWIAEYGNTGDALCVPMLDAMCALTLTPNALVTLLTEMLLVRNGAVIDESVCRERANNIAQALAGYRIMT